ncbi:MAG: hypothetical protein M1419_00425 [Bacteroidetes bacterium]|nr:hypothetical protein [Bacteroidota bacterium]
MDDEQSKLLLKVKDFAKDWITKVVSKKKSYQDKLLDALEMIIPDCEFEDKRGDARYFHECYFRKGFDSALIEFMEEYSPDYFGISKKGHNDLTNALRIGGDFFIWRGAGVLGYTVGDLFKVFDGNLPKEVRKYFYMTRLKKADLNDIIRL